MKLLACRSALAMLLAGFIACGACAQEISRTFFLVARPGLPDPNFRQTVVLVHENDPAQFVGVIINRPTDRSFSDLLPGERFRGFTDPIFIGGPVELNGLFAVFRADRFAGAAIALVPGLYLALHPDAIDSLINSPPARIRFFAGYSGWAPGQLRGELERGDWLMVDADADVVFRKDTSSLWQDMLRRASAVRADATMLRAASSDR